MKRILLITGATGGIGRALVRLVAETGHYAVCINYMQDENMAFELRDMMRDKGRSSIALQADVSKEEDVLRMFEEIDIKLGPVNALVNNAGIISPIGKLEEMSANRIKRVFEVNVLGSFLCAREAIKRMSISNGGNGGAIVNVSSAAARWGSPNEFIDYAATKGAMDTFTIGLSKEVSNEGIRVNAVRPGLIDTEIHAKAGAPDRVRDLTSSIPIGRPGRADEVAEAILWLLGDSASYVNGALLDVAGGR